VLDAIATPPTEQPQAVRRHYIEGLTLQLSEISTPRPMTYDLTARLLEVAEARVEKVAVISLRDNAFYATVWVGVGNRLHEVDARPSDALSLALRLNAPIFVTPEVFEQARVSLALTGSGYVLHLPDGQQVQGPELKILLEEWHRKDMEEKDLPPETPEMEHLSFRSLPRGDVGDNSKPAAK
jgi:Domain of unknown function (DUF151)